MRRLVMLLNVSLLVACDSSAPDSSVSDIVGGSDFVESTYASVIPGRVLSFPEEHIAHPDFRQEWWYLTANLQSEDGRRFGVQWTQFRMALEPDRQRTLSGWQTDQVFLAHSAITDAEWHMASEKWSRRHAVLAEVTGFPLKIHLDNWIWQSEGEGLLPAELTVDSPEFSYRFSLTGNSPIQLQGENGFSIKSADGKVASYYYSQPFIDVEGVIGLKGELINVSGHAWLDREWSSQFLTDSQQGWDWFALRLDDGSALMIFQLRATKEQQDFYSARRMFPDGSGYNIGSQDIQMTPLQSHTIEGVEYPVEWRINIPGENIGLSVKALNPDSRMPLSISYWEGPVTFTGTHSGVGYMELTGYR